MKKNKKGVFYETPCITWLRAKAATAFSAS